MLLGAFRETGASCNIWMLLVLFLEFECHRLEAQCRVIYEITISQGIIEIGAPHETNSIDLSKRVQRLVMGVHDHDFIVGSVSIHILKKLQTGSIRASMSHRAQELPRSNHTLAQ